jgi:hypothetical protein
MASGGSGLAALAEARQRRISSLLVESICGKISTVKAGKRGATACQMASAAQRTGVFAAGLSALTDSDMGAGKRGSVFFTFEFLGFLA